MPMQGRRSRDRIADSKWSIKRPLGKIVAEVVFSIGLLFNRRRCGLEAGPNQRGRPAGPTRGTPVRMR